MTEEKPAERSATARQSQAGGNAAGPARVPEAEPPDTAILAAGARQDITAGIATSAAPDDLQQLTDEIERTREQLGETVEALAAKADVKARAKDQASQLSGFLKTTVSQAWQKAAAQTGQARSQLAGKTTRPRQKLRSLSEPAGDQVRDQAAAASATFSKATPDAVQRAVKTAAVTARERRVPLAVAVAAAVLALLVIARWRQR
jgi:CHASE3 domain sensor protein